MTAPGPYCELHAHSCYSLLDGVPFPEQLADRAADLGLPALALTDHNALYGLVPFAQRARERGLRAILGAELSMADGSHLTLLAENAEGYASLCQLVTLGRMSAPKGGFNLGWDALAEYTQGLICLTGCRLGPVAGRLAQGRKAEAKRALSGLMEFFGRRNVYVELQRNLRRDDIKISRQLAGLALERGLPYVATGNVHYLDPADADLQSALVSIRERQPLPRAGDLLRPNRQYFLRSAAGMAELFPDLPRALKTTLEVAERCSAVLPGGLQVLPEFPRPGGMSADRYLRLLCELRLPRLYPDRLAEAQALLDKELDLIAGLRLANYFLIVWDIVTYCARSGILCHGRGSAANSLAARLLGISAVDPIKQGLVVERFLSVEHGGTPDIDLDIDAMRREEVIQYVYTRWGRDQAAMACTYVTFRSASAIRDAGFALGFKQETVAAIAQAVEGRRREEELDEDGRVDHADTPVAELAGARADLSSDEWRQLTALAGRLQGRPRHLGLHNGGMVLTGEPIARRIPIEPASMENRTVTQFDKEWLEALGLVKIDLLGLRMLSAVADALDIVKAVHGREIDLHRLDYEERAVYDEICTARTIGLFQVESGAQVSLIPRMQPRCFDDLSIEVSLIRPGPLQGGMVQPYVRRRQGLEPVTYLHPLLEPALKETLGVVVFQEQVIKVARDVGGFTAGRGEVLRRALGNKRAAEVVARFREEFLAGAAAKGVPEIKAAAIWEMIAGFAGYSFSKAHACAFSVIVFWSAWLRLHYTAEFFCGLLRNSPLGTYPAHVLESEARRKGVKFLSFDINHSEAKPVLQDGAIRHGLGYVHGIGEALAERIVRERTARPFDSLADFLRRTETDRRSAEWLILAGALDGFGERRQLLWDLAEAFDLIRRPAALPLDLPDERAAMDPMSAERKLMLTFAAARVTGGLHLTSLRRDAFAKAGCVPFEKLGRLPLGRKVRVGGIVADGVRRPPTAHGTAFVRLDQSEGIVDVIIPQEIYLQYREVFKSAFVVVEGVLQRREPPIAVLARRAMALP